MSCGHCESQEAGQLVEQEAAPTYTWTDTARALVRPGGAILGILVIAGLIVGGAIAGAISVPAAIAAATGFFGPIIGFYTGGRTAEKAAQEATKNGGAT